MVKAVRATMRVYECMTLLVQEPGQSENSIRAKFTEKWGATIAVSDSRVGIGRNRQQACRSVALRRRRGIRPAADHVRHAGCPIFMTSARSPRIIAARSRRLRAF
jgi:hypothetical protein